MIRILAVCALGGSISFFTTKMIQIAKKLGLDLQIDILPVDIARRTNLDKYDLIIIAPQVRHHYDSVRKQAVSKPVILIDSSLYATYDAESFLKNQILPYLKSSQ